MMPLNPVEQQMVLLCNEWSKFTQQHDKNCLVWDVKESAKRITFCFFEAQKHETEYSTGDLFIVFDVPFEHSVQYSRDLKLFIKGCYEASLTELQKQEIDPDWEFSPNQLPHTASGFIESMQSFGSCFHTHIGNLVIVLAPSSTSEVSHFQNWLLRALQNKLPQRLNFLLMDSAENPEYQLLNATITQDVARKFIDMDGWKVAQTMFAQEPALNPSAVFRNHMMGVLSLMDKGKASQVNVKAQDALKFARKQGWNDQEVSLRLMVAGAYLKEKKFDEAAQVYRAALAFNNENLKNNPLQYKLAIQCLFGEAAAYLGAGKQNKAVQSYQQIAKIATANNDTLQIIEADRMAGFCYQQMGDKNKALEYSLSAFKHCESLNTEDRSVTTGSVAAMDMLRTLDEKRVNQMILIKAEMLAGQRALLDKAEQKAASLEQYPDKHTEEHIINVLAEHGEKDKQQVEKKLLVLVEDASKEFHRVFTKGREIFGFEWPMFDPLAIPLSADQIKEAGKKTT